MPRPKTKEQLLIAMRTERDGLEQALTALTQEQLCATSTITRWAIKDVLAHIFEWEQMCLSWYKAGLKGITPAVPGEGFNWSQLPAEISEEDLFTPGRYAWTKTSTLGAYFVSATASHYAWARKEVHKCLKGMH